MVDERPTQSPVFILIWSFFIFSSHSDLFDNFILKKKFLVAAGQEWQDRVEAAITFYSVHVGVGAMAVCSIAQHRIAERAAFLRSRPKVMN